MSKCCADSDDTILGGALIGRGAGLRVGAWLAAIPGAIGGGNAVGMGGGDFSGMTGEASDAVVTAALTTTCSVIAGEGARRNSEKELLPLSNKACSKRESPNAWRKFRLKESSMSGLELNLWQVINVESRSVDEQAAFYPLFLASA